MTRAATTLAGPCTGAPRRDFLLGLRHGQLVGAHVPSWCSRHGVDAGCSRRAGPPGQLTTRGYQTPPEGTGVGEDEVAWAIEQIGWGDSHTGLIAVPTGGPEPQPYDPDRMACPCSVC